MIKLINKINSYIEKKDIVIFTLFLYLQPILDMITGIMANYNMTFKMSLVIRVLFLIFSIYYTCFIKRKNVKYMSVIFLYSICFLLTNFFLKKDGNIIVELEVLVKNIYLPIMVVFVLNLFKEKEFDIRHLYRILLIYILFIFIPDIFKIGFNSYSYAKLGSIGFFYSANAVGSILSFIMPLLVADLIKKNHKLLLILFSLIYLYIIFTMGTKAPILCVGIIILYYFVLFIINLIKKKKYASMVATFMLITLFVLLFIKIVPNTAFYKNLIIHLEFLKVKSISDLFTFKNFDHFIFSARLSFLKEAFTLFNKSSFMQKLFGLGYIIDGKQIKTSEMDFFVTLIHQGILGFIVIYYAYFKYMVNIFKEYLKNFKKNFDSINKTSIVLSLVISILGAFLAGHVLETPSVIIFVATIIGNAYFVFNDRKVKGKRKDEKK